MNKKINLALFFTRGMSLEIWIRTGLFDREKLIYEKHLEVINLKKIYWITYGSNDYEISKELKKKGRLHKDIEVCEMPKIFKIPKIGSYLYSIFVPFYYKIYLKECDIIKTNQMNGSWSALISKYLYKKPLLLRTGYTQSIFMIKQHRNKLQIMFSKFIEKIMYARCDHATVGSNNDKKYVSSLYDIKSNQITVLHNYIDTNIFKQFNIEEKNDFIFVGRLSEQKNLFNLIKAISQTSFSLDIYGEGEQKEELKKIVLINNAKVNFKGVVSNKELPNILNKYKYYILPSFYEGMPKTLLEAMACGSICIGTNVEGIHEVIKDKENGFLINGTTSNDILCFLKKLDTKKNLYSYISKNAVETIINQFSIDHITHEENKIIRMLYENNNR